MCALFMCVIVFNLYNNKCLFVVALKQLFHILLTTEIFKPRLFSSRATRLHTRLTELLLLVVCIVLPFYRPTQTVWWTFLKEHVRVRVFSRLHCYLCIVYTLLFVRSLTCLSLSLSHSCCCFTCNLVNIKRW